MVRITMRVWREIDVISKEIVLVRDPEMAKVVVLGETDLATTETKLRRAGELRV